MATQQLTRKHIPEYYTQWLKEVEGVRRFLANVKGKRPMHGQEWVASMEEYYLRRLDDLLNHMPTKGKPIGRKPKTK